MGRTTQHLPDGSSWSESRFGEVVVVVEPRFGLVALGRCG